MHSQLPLCGMFVLLFSNKSLAFSAVFCLSHYTKVRLSSRECLVFVGGSSGKTTITVAHRLSTIRNSDTLRHLVVRHIDNRPDGPGPGFQRSQSPFESLSDVNFSEKL